MKSRTAVTTLVIGAVLTFGAWRLYVNLSEYPASKGLAEGQQTIERLQLVWPGFLQMPERDRLLLADLAMRCPLHEESAQPDNVLGCHGGASRDEEGRAALHELLSSQYVGKPTATD